jgi:hypothetical protein
MRILASAARLNDGLHNKRTVGKINKDDIIDDGREINKQAIYGWTGGGTQRR